MNKRINNIDNLKGTFVAMLKMKTMLKVWALDFIKLTPSEALSLKEAEDECAKGEYVEYKF